MGGTAVLTTVYHQCNSDKHAKVCTAGGPIKVVDSMPKGSGDVVYELHLLPTELTPDPKNEHIFEARWADAERRPFQVYTR